MRIAALYLVGAWAAVEIAATTFPLMELPAWAPKLVLGVALAGFPLALVLAWVFDLTDGGVERTPPVVREPKPDSAEGGPDAGRIAAIGGALIIASAGAAFFVQRGDPPPLETNRVVVDPFENRTGDPELDAVGTMAADWLVRTLQSMADIEVVPLTATLAMGAAVEDHSTRPDFLAAEFGARLIVTGSYYLEGDSLRIVADVTDAAKREILHSTDPITAPRAGPSEGLEALQQNLAGFIGLWGGFTHAAAPLMRPPSYEAYQEFATGIRLFVRGDYHSALPYLDQSIALDSTFATAIVYAAVSHMNLGRRTQVEPYLDRLERMRTRLTAYEAIYLDWLIASHGGDRQGTLRAARRAVDAAPSVATWRYLVGLHALALNRPVEAIESLEKIDPDGYLAREWRPYWTVFASALHLAERYQEERDVLRHGRERHPDHGTLIVQEIGNLAALGRLDQAERSLEGAYVLATDATLSTGAVLRLAAQELLVHGHPRPARSAAERAVESYPPISVSADGNSTGHRSDLARALYLAGRYDEARPLLERLLADAPDDIIGLVYLALVAVRLGDMGAAESADTRLAALGSTLPGAVFQRARVAAARGERDRAVSLLRQAFRDGYPMNMVVHRAPELLDLQDFPPFVELMGWKG